ncbi:FTR1 family iron permease [Sulfurirhabdus autotrophica]|uniref:High-affinity iron transporter n=1 Tax=Sulfurirhabdus autotrophica TaxID=1706046 RepID=A0A4R3XP48_9PROT|nr:FTR1 family protein [Sulfurirhabdus autotrophica]TCV79188.1 high-affinity iron transporter [Sulfurirhabdus autotrophica]
MGNALFIVWRETIEAMLVIGILHGWLSARPEARAGFPWLWGGIATGLGLAVFLAVTIMDIQSSVSSNTLEWFQAIMPLVACALIFQMVWWMRRHGAGLKNELEAGMASAADRANWVGIAVLAAVAVGREGAEAVVFLYGAVKGEPNTDIALGSALGFILALAAYWLLSRGSRFVSWRAFFRVTEVLLLLLGGALLVDGAEKLVGMEALPPLADPLWNTVFLLDDSTRVGGLVAAFTGYRAAPSGMSFALLATYWTLALGVILKLKPKRRAA